MRNIRNFLFWAILLDLVWLVFITICFHYMNQPSDLALTGGVLGLMVSAMIFPDLNLKLYRHYIHQHSVQPKEAQQEESK